MALEMVGGPEHVLDVFCHEKYNTCMYGWILYKMIAACTACYEEDVGKHESANLLLGTSKQREEWQAHTPWNQ